MRVLYQRCCGLDVHKESVMACVLTPEGKQIRKFGTMTKDLLMLSDWLATFQVTHVAMESTGVFWQPIYNLLEEEFTVWVVNARHIKNVPGRKTDVKDAEWIADLLSHGLLSPSFIPGRGQGELRVLDAITLELEELDREVATRMGPNEEAIERLDSIPGVGRRSAEEILAETGTDMSRFPTAAHLASWAKVSPGNNESTGKRQSGRTGNGNPWIKSALTEAAQAAAKTKDKYFAAQYRRLAPRRGRKRAVAAVAHSI